MLSSKATIANYIDTIPSHVFILFSAADVYVHTWIFNGIWSFIFQDLESVSNIFKQETFTTCKHHSHYMSILAWSHMHY